MLKRDPRKTYHYGDLADAMVAEGTAEVEREGLGRVSMRRIAERLDVSSAAPWHHFRNRASFTAAIAEAGFRKLRLTLDRRRSQERSATENLAQTFQTYTWFAINNAGLYRAMFNFEISQGLERLDMADPGRDRHFVALLVEKGLTFDLFVELVREGQEAGEVRAGDPSRIGRVVTSLAHGLALEFIDERLGTRTSRRREAEELFAILMNGIGQRRMAVSIKSLGAEDSDDEYLEYTPAQRVGMMWELAKNAYSLTTRGQHASRLSRSNLRVQRRAR